MKKLYNEAVLEVVDLCADDVISTSVIVDNNTGSEGDNEGPLPW